MSGQGNWASPLRLSVIFFLIWGLVWAVSLVGLPLLFAGGFPPWLLFSVATDTALFGASPSAIRAAQPASAEAQWFLSHMTGIGVSSAGTAISAIAWFGLRRRERWAFWSLVAAAIPIAVLYPLAVARYVRPGVPFGLGDLQPFVLLPAFLVPPASCSATSGSARANVVLERGEGHAVTLVVHRDCAGTRSWPRTRHDHEPSQRMRDDPLQPCSARSPGGWRSAGGRLWSRPRCRAAVPIGA